MDVYSPKDDEIGVDPSSLLNVANAPALFRYENGRMSQGACISVFLGLEAQCQPQIDKPWPWIPSNFQTINLVPLLAGNSGSSQFLGYSKLRRKLLDRSFSSLSNTLSALPSVEEAPHERSALSLHPEPSEATAPGKTHGAHGAHVSGSWIKPCTTGLWATKFKVETLW